MDEQKIRADCGHVFDEIKAVPLFANALFELVEAEGTGNFYLYADVDGTRHKVVTFLPPDETSNGKPCYFCGNEKILDLGSEILEKRMRPRESKFAESIMTTFGEVYNEKFGPKNAFTAIQNDCRVRKYRWSLVDETALASAKIDENIIYLPSLIHEPTEHVLTHERLHLFGKKNDRHSGFNDKSLQTGDEMAKQLLFNIFTGDVLFDESMVDAFCECLLDGNHITTGYAPAVMLTRSLLFIYGKETCFKAWKFDNTILQKLMNRTSPDAYDKYMECLGELGKIIASKKEFDQEYRQIMAKANRMLLKFHQTMHPDGTIEDFLENVKQNIKTSKIGHENNYKFLGKQPSPIQKFLGSEEDYFKFVKTSCEIEPVSPELIG